MAPVKLFKIIPNNLFIRIKIAIIVAQDRQIFFFVLLLIFKTSINQDDDSVNIKRILFCQILFSQIIKQETNIREWNLFHIMIMQYNLSWDFNENWSIVTVVFASSEPKKKPKLYDYADLGETCATKIEKTDFWWSGEIWMNLSWVTFLFCFVFFLLVIIYYKINLCNYLKFKQQHLLILYLLLNSMFSL